MFDDIVQRFLDTSVETESNVCRQLFGQRDDTEVDVDSTGFDPADLRPKDSLGLVSMRERARLVSGRLTLTSKRGEGTCVEVQVPLHPNQTPSL